MAISGLGSGGGSVLGAGSNPNANISQNFLQQQKAQQEITLAQDDTYSALSADGGNDGSSDSADSTNAAN